MGAFLELLRRLGGATADAAAGFLFSEDPSTDEEQQEEEHESLIDVPADSAEIKQEHVRDSPLDAICEALTESMDEVGSSHDHSERSSFEPEIANESDGMDHTR